MTVCPREIDDAHESLRLIGGRSPGSRDSRRPRHPRALEHSQL